MDALNFSVSMCVYGKDDPKNFRTAVESILNQTLSPTEVVLVVDGPVPQVINEIIVGYEQNPIFHVIRLKENQGHGNARRIGLENCKYELVALMDADDISVPERFQKQVAVFTQNRKLAIVGGNITEFIDSIDHSAGKRNVPEADAEIKTYMRKRCPMNQVTVMFRLTDVQEVGGYVDWYCEEDYYLWLRLALAGKKFHNIQENLVYVRVGEEMYQRRGGLKYFKSETKLQKFMFKNQIISLGRFMVNVTERMVVQVLMPTRLRSLVFRKFARE